MSIFAALGGFIAANGGPVAVAVIGAQIIGRSIPDNKKGVLGVIRKVAKTVGMYATPDLNKVRTRQTDILADLAAQEVAKRLNPASRARQKVSAADNIREN